MWKQSRDRKRKLKKLAKETECNWCSGAYWDEDRGCYIRYSISRRANGCRSFVKKRCNRYFRRLSKHLETNCKGINHKMTEFWWEID